MKYDKQHIMDELLVKYLLGEADARELHEVESWLGAREENRRYFEGFKTIWDESRRLSSVSTIDENKAWERFQRNIEHEEQTKVLPFTTAKKKWSLTRIAAVIIVVLAGAWTAYFLTERSGSVHFEAGDQVLACNLPDGSVVTLNRHATLDYHKRGKDGIREVQLNGEGFFDVAPDKKHPFIIKVKDVTVKVVGTSFNVKSANDKTEISVETGIVDVSKNNHSVLLERNERAIVSRHDDKPRKFRSTDNLYNYYRSKEMVCNGTPLYNVVDMLNEAYGAPITIANPGIKNLPLNTTIPAGATLDDILAMISGTFNIKVERGGGNIILK